VRERDDRDARCQPVAESRLAMIQSIHCPVLGAHVTRVTDFEGHVSQVICSEYDLTGMCRLTKQAVKGSPLTQLLERTAEDTLSTRDTRCVLRSA